MAKKAIGDARCPVCGCLDIDGWEVRTEGGLATQDCICDSCGSSWNDVYQLCDQIVTENAMR